MKLKMKLRLIQNKWDENRKKNDNGSQLEVLQLNPRITQ